MAYGQKSALGIVFQTAYGTTGSVNSIHFLPVVSENIKLNIPPKYVENMRGVFDEGDTYDGARSVEGEIDVQCQPLSSAVLLKMVLEETTTATSGSVVTRTFKPRVSDFSSLSANNPVTAYAFRDVGSAMIYDDLSGSTLEISVSNDELLKMKVSVVGGGFSQNAEVAASYTTGPHFPWNVTSLSLGGLANTEFTELSITLDDGSLEAMHTINGTKYPSRIKRTASRNIAVSGTLKFDTQTEYQNFINQSEQALSLTFVDGTEIQSGYTNLVNITLPSMRYEEAAPAAEGPGYIEMSVTARGKYHVGSGSSMSVTHISTLASL